MRPWLRSMFSFAHRRDLPRAQVARLRSLLRHLASITMLPWPLLYCPPTTSAAIPSPFWPRHVLSLSLPSIHCPRLRTLNPFISLLTTGSIYRICYHTLSDLGFTIVSAFVTILFPLWLPHTYCICRPHTFITTVTVPALHPALQPSPRGLHDAWIQQPGCFR